MASRCPDCNKFVSLNFEDPEVEDPEIDFEDDGTLTITCDARIVRACADCGTEMKEANFQLEQRYPLPTSNPDAMKRHCILYDAAEAGANHKPDLKYKMKEDCEFIVEEDGHDQIEEGGGRYQKSYFGVSVNVLVTCKCQRGPKDTEPVAELTLEDKVAASGMDEC